MIIMKMLEMIKTAMILLGVEYNKYRNVECFYFTTFYLQMYLSKLISIYENLHSSRFSR